MYSNTHSHTRRIGDVCEGVICPVDILSFVIIYGSITRHADTQAFKMRVFRDNKYISHNLCEFKINNYFS